MLHKHLGLILFIFSLCFCVRAYGQNIDVTLEIGLYSPYIKKYTKEQMTKKLLDSVISYCRSRYLKFGRPLNIYTKDNGQPKSNLPGYKLELNVIDTVFNHKHFTCVHAVTVKSNFYEEEIPAENIRGEMSGGGASYSLMPAFNGVETDTVEAETNEADAIRAYFTWATIRAEMALNWSMPLSLTERIPARNIFEKDELNQLESFNEMVVKIETEKINASTKNDIDRLITLINNIFFCKQVGVARRRSLNKGRGQLNYYFTTDSSGYTGPTVRGNPIELKVILESIGPNDYQIKFEFDEQKYLFRNFFGVAKKERFLLISGETLRKTPSKVNTNITDWIETFVNSNTR